MKQWVLGSLNNPEHGDGCLCRFERPSTWCDCTHQSRKFSEPCSLGLSGCSMAWAWLIKSLVASLSSQKSQGENKSCSFLYHVVCSSGNWPTSLNYLGTQSRVTSLTETRVWFNQLIVNNRRCSVIQVITRDWRRLCEEEPLEWWGPGICYQMRWGSSMSQELQRGKKSQNIKPTTRQRPTSYFHHLSYILNPRTCSKHRNLSSSGGTWHWLPMSVEITFEIHLTHVPIPLCSCKKEESHDWELICTYGS